MSRLFGTDGIRGVAGQEPLTPETITRVSRALGNCLQQSGAASHAEGSPFVIIGHDGRASSDCIVAAAEAGLTAAGIDTQEAGLITTPGLATLVRELCATGGVMISASHNAAHDNGIKLFNSSGDKLQDSIEKSIEASVAHAGTEVKPPQRFGVRRAGAAIRPELYLGGLVERSGLEPGALAGFKIAFDGANGGGSFLGPDLLRSLGAEVVEIATSPDGLNINENCGALHPEHLAKIVVSEKCVLGLALDGDGDRAMFIDETGAVVDGDGVIAACAPDLATRGKLPSSAVVVSIMSNFGLQQFLRDRGIKTDQVPVGDRHVVARLRERLLALGAEPSGHVVFGADNAYTGDGLYCALRVLELMRRRDVSLSSVSRFPRSEQVMINVRVAKRVALETLPDVQKAHAAAEAALAGLGRVVLRYSGTEPLVRVMVESSDANLAKRWSGEIADAVRKSLI